MRLRILFVLLAVAGLFPAHMSAQPAAKLTLSKLLLRIETHPALEMKRAEIEAARSRIPMRSSLMDPTLILGVQNVPTNFSFNQDAMTAKVAGIEQEFPFPGKLGKERTLGELSVRQVEATLAEEQNRLRRDVKLSWFEILHRQRSVSAYRYHQDALESVEKEITTGVAYGKNSALESEQIQLERTEIRQMIIEEQAMILMEYAKLTYATGTEITTISSLDSLPLVTFPYTADSLMLMATNRPLLSGIEASIEQAGISIERSKLNRYPDFSAMLMYMQRDALAPGTMGTGTSFTPQMNMLTAQISIKLPLNYSGKNDAGISEAEAMRGMKRAEEDMVRREIKMMLSEQLARLQELRAKHELLVHQSLPTLRTINQFLVSGYGFDKSSLSSIVLQELSLLHKQHDQFEIESEYYKTIAQIEFLIGTDLISMYH